MEGSYRSFGTHYRWWRNEKEEPVTTRVLGGSEEVPLMEPSTGPSPSLPLIWEGNIKCKIFLRLTQLILFVHIRVTTQRLSRVMKKDSRNRKRDYNQIKELNYRLARVIPIIIRN